MNDVVSSAEKVRSEIDKFVKELLGSSEWDVIVPILRKGRLVLLSTVQDLSSKIHLPPFYGVDKIENKSVLILDDKALHGHKMSEIYDQVLSAGALKGNVKTAAFVKNRACKLPIDYHFHELEDMEYARKESDLGLYYESLCLQLDADHLVAKCNLSSSSLGTRACQRFPKAVEQIASDIGVFYPQDSIARLWGREKFGIADIPLSRLGAGHLDQLITDEGVQKIRFCLEPCGELLIMPIFYPEIHIDNNICKEALEGRTRFCEQISERATRTSEFCRECVDFNLQTTALRSLLPPLLERLRKAEFAIQVNTLGWPELEYKYPSFKTILGHHLKEIREL